MEIAIHTNIYHKTDDKPMIKRKAKSLIFEYLGTHEECSLQDKSSSSKPPFLAFPLLFSIIPRFLFINFLRREK